MKERDEQSKREKKDGEKSVKEKYVAKMLFLFEKPSVLFFSILYFNTILVRLFLFLFIVIVVVVVVQMVATVFINH